MGVFSDIFSKNKEIRAIDNYPAKEDKEDRGLYDSNTNSSFESFFKTDIPVSEETVNLIPVAVSCLELITSSVAQLPIKLYKKLNNGDVVEIKNDKRIYLLNVQPNDNITGYNLKKQWVRDYLLYGRCYSYVERKGNDVKSLYILPARDCTPSKVYNIKEPHKADYEIRYTSSSGYGSRIYQPHELFVCLRNTFDGVNTIGILEQGEVTFKLALSTMEYNVNVLNNGALPVGVLEAQTRLTEPALKRLRKSWESLYSGAKNVGKTIILEEGLKYNSISLKPGELQLTESKKVVGEDIAKLFNTPYSLISAEANKYNSVEQNNLHYLEYTLNPILVSFQSAFDKFLLLESEKEQNYFFEFDTSEIMTMTQTDIINNLVKATKNGLYSLNEARSDLRKPKINKEFLQFSLGSVFYDMKTEEMVIPNMSTTIDKDGKFHNANIEQQQKLKEQEEKEEDNKSLETEDSSNVQDESKDTKMEKPSTNKKDSSTKNNPKKNKTKK